MAPRSTRTYVELPVPREVWELIWSKLNDAGYDHAIDNDEGVIDMHGLALVVDTNSEKNSGGEDAETGMRP